MKHLIVERSLVARRTAVPALEELLPPQKGVSYVMKEFTELPLEEFSGAPEHAFEATIRIN